MIAHPDKPRDEHIAGARNRRQAVIEHLNLLAQQLDVLRSWSDNERDADDLAATRSAVVRAHNLIVEAPQIPGVR